MIVEVKLTRIRLSKEERKRQIKEVALQLFIDKGLIKTTIEDIIEGSGISKGGLYYHFQNKEEIFEELIKDSMEYRKCLISDYINENPTLSRQEIILNMLLDKILDKNPYKTLYALFLTEIKSSNELKDLYKKIYSESNNEFIQFCIQEHLPEYITLTNEVSEFFINSMILGTNLLENKKDEEVREMLRVMLDAYLKSKDIF